MAKSRVKHTDAVILMQHAYDIIRNFILVDARLPKHIYNKAVSDATCSRRVTLPS